MDGVGGERVTYVLPLLRHPSPADERSVYTPTAMGGRGSRGLWIILEVHWSTREIIKRKYARHCEAEVRYGNTFRHHRSAIHAWSVTERCGFIGGTGFLRNV